MEHEGPPPICPSCCHPHFPDVRCSVCGHKGKGKSYLLVAKTTAPSSSSLHFEAFDTRGDAAVFKSRMALARILRGRVFVEECQVLETQEFDAHDKACRHVIGLVGDAPVLYGRWRLEESAGGGTEGAVAGAGAGANGTGAMVAVIDRLAVLQSHRGRGYSTAAFEFLLGDVEETARGMQCWVAGVVATVPAGMGPMGDKLQARWGFEVAGAPYPERNTTFVRMFRAAQQQAQPQAPPT